MSAGGDAWFERPVHQRLIYFVGLCLCLCLCPGLGESCICIVCLGVRLVPRLSCCLAYGWSTSCCVGLLEMCLESVCRFGGRRLMRKGDGSAVAGCERLLPQAPYRLDRDALHSSAVRRWEQGVPAWPRDQECRMSQNCSPLHDSTRSMADTPLRYQTSPDSPSSCSSSSLQPNYPYPHGNSREPPTRTGV